jgi:hypothetical protein
LTPNKSLSVGVGTPGCGISWSGACLGVQCEDGLMLDGDHPGSQVVQPQSIEENSTIGFGRSGGRFEFTVNGRPHDLPTRQEFGKVHALVTLKNASFSLFMNTGQFPFTCDGPSEGEVELFNRIRVPMSHDRLEEFGLMKDDVVESRDRQFIGKVIGAFDGRPFFQVPGIDGAVCLNSTDPLFHRMLLRVVSRPALEDHWVPVVGLDGVQRINVGSRATYPPMSILGGQFGMSLFAGSSANGQAIVRPVVDLVSSANALALRADIGQMVIGSNGLRFREIDCVFFRKHANVWPLDVTVSTDSSLCVVLGYRTDTAVIGFDGAKLVDVPQNAVPLFRFIGYDRGYRSASQCYILYRQQASCREAFSHFRTSSAGSMAVTW